VTKNTAITVLNLVTPKAAAKQELLFNKLASEVGLLNKSFAVLLKSDSEVQ
jgi:hypothetical protein